ncbi:nitroreductase family protein [methanotrophic endosymbiont of Bathymodiolus puteoserpentis (Logatchev)]|jgi:nitroreductase|uniref:nitroreductase family protein n=1 Tax=methanotrophic endosymbiont of Bathymodiolus puteoserpentis (Logatchev) TaxID=343235 RepID=UPI0013C81CEC|nr:nitroreductase family protein [methanotrophic endosymbiont of Bathymodiolus puteoserpentis (Logatchev)]SHE21648.1 Oxygen-insensitive NAD(P)H nitroreductase / Dihydropteridine reductase [methanotrophic endosymbiont of Bathymodiolus puteoserpentis (Logatchev)]
MNTLEAIQARRSVKYYDVNHQMTEVEINQLLSLAMLSPTAFNIQHWRFVNVTEPELRQKIRAVAWDQAQVTDASLFLVICADLKAWEKQPERYWKNADQAVQDFIVPAIDQYYRGKDQVQRDEAMRSCGIAAQTLMLAAKDMGYDSCPMDGFDFEQVGQLINLPEDHVIALCLAVGKGVQAASPRAGQLAKDEVIVLNRFAALD